jgi:hypothetical protein
LNQSKADLKRPRRVRLSEFWYKWAKIRAALAPRIPTFFEKFNKLASDPRWWIATLAGFLLYVVLSPFIQEGRWPAIPFVGFSTSTVVVHEAPTAEDIAKAQAPIKADLGAANQRAASLQAQLDTAIRERDAARQSHGENVVSASPQPAPSPETIKVDDIEARIDAWKSIDGQMNDLRRFLGEGDHIVANWKTSQAALSQMLVEFRNHIAVLQERLSQLVAANADFSDLKAVDQAVLSKLASAIGNLLETSSQLPKETTQDGYETSVGPYVGLLKRQLTTAKQWADGVKNLASSSVSDLSARQVSK